MSCRSVRGHLIRLGSFELENLTSTTVKFHLDQCPGCDEERLDWIELSSELVGAMAFNPNKDYWDYFGARLLQLISTSE